MKQSHRERAEKVCITSTHHTPSGCGTGCEIDDIELLAQAFQDLEAEVRAESAEQIKNLQDSVADCYRKHDFKEKDAEIERLSLENKALKIHAEPVKVETGVGTALELSGQVQRLQAQLKTVRADEREKCAEEANRWLHGYQSAKAIRQRGERDE